MPIIMAILYLTACAICGLMGRRTAFGFLGHFLLSLVITPVGDFLVQIVSRPSRELRQKLDKLDLD
ncbi:hypothetical protein WH50_11025 [Pokkaliibacter plantistimulans]|uniref:Uncharacterized protein n=2 Tax=Pseudomonadota TaxID=1224 RepID=A0ABX5M2Q4_9GAMM|nr:MULTISPECIES: hypothetical protein [Pokkaliibacter]MDH2434870.1 hypothetical protein [Pokkaliibacter sp. MBI-7]PPC76625.1 hypothetical protein C4K68_14455 [Pokkaliibacter plantistimulans]PXF31170.1 hypothetical protein WH50_11025 [Pokkaliibacter plantistimulans]